MADTYLDTIEAVAVQLHRAYVTDTRRSDEQWADLKPAMQAAWRRAAAQAIDLGAKP